MIYAHLLRAEILELAKDKAASWDGIMEIRHLKDRMIRKCQRLSRGASIRDKNTSRVMFFTVHAPPDFRMKEMERWFRAQGPEVMQAEEVMTRTTPYCCDKCGPLLPQTAQSQTRRTHSGSRTTAKGVSERIARRPSASQLGSTSRQPQSGPRAQPQKQARSETSPPPLPVPTRSRSVSRNVPAARQQSSSRTPPYVPTPDPSRHASLAHGLRTEHPGRANLQSPDPVPIPHRPPHEHYDDDEGQDVDIPVVDRSPSPVHDQRHDDDDLYADDDPLSTPPIAHTPNSNQTGFALETIHEFGGEPGQERPRPTLPRRRSSLKKSGSMSRLSIISQTKSVSWAMDKDWMDQMAKFEEVTKEAEIAAKELDDVRAAYYDEVHEMRNIFDRVNAAEETIRHETESLRRDDSALRDQEYKLLHMLERMEYKESEYHKTVITVLEETRRVVQLCDKKRDHHDV
ncbi:hypothetical protein EUX98_g120 [Antrodiella citrinella]|uniref:Uncharacterized protein n=1 Tax=Antrodiella citrinella TaxID=2447956 RepID=A0A4S4NDL8_9APHY|nr:hypothetical protein EUX98_g120 [Antrodiella citrinella]